MTTKLVCGQTGEQLHGEVSAYLACRSLSDRTRRGWVGAYRDRSGVWRWTEDCDSRRTHMVRVVTG
jgi:hypothetical protein